MWYNLLKTRLAGLAHQQIQHGFYYIKSVSYSFALKMTKKVVIKASTLNAMVPA